ncbi:hypothetical protein [Azospirillum sp. B4]|uniref:hypothetical protein n=1 Tax=Azospirillum sp. B4 TaxID=95605 RepID=UPI0011DD5796|nr:hypothetical protein [Azospirillum sp. B4]
MKKYRQVNSDNEQIKSVYDFLYHDARRIGSFLSQIDPNGHLQSLRKSAQSGENTSKKSVVGGGGGVPGVANIQGSREDQLGEQWNQNAERIYDPLWKNAMDFIRILDSKSLISKDINTAGIGQFVKVSGLLSVKNLKISKDAWEMPTIFKRIGIGESENIDERQLENNKLGMEIIKIMPYTVQATIYDDGDNKSISWMALDEENMVISPGNIIMKYGYIIPGVWTVIGIKDADADVGATISTDLVQKISENWEAAARERATTVVALVTEILSLMGRMVMGRPGGYLGITPIIIFREIA